LRVKVECYSGYKANERPISFYLGESRLKVIELLDQWYGPGSIYFRIRADDDNLYILRCHSTAQEDMWTLESFRKERHE